MREKIRFLSEWASSPLQTAAITPSSTALARLITSEIGPAHQPVIELGPGTGVFTSHILERGVPEDRIALVELNERFAEKLRAKFPTAQVHNISATEIGSETFFETPAGAVISGLGFLAMDDDTVEAIVAGAFRHLRLDGAMYQFTYGPKCPVAAATLDRHGLIATRIGRTVRNLPPASVYRIRRAPDAAD